MAERTSRTTTTTTPSTEVDTTSEHVLGDNAERAPERAGFHDSVSGKPVDEQGRFLDGTEGGPIDSTHIVANNWPELQEESAKSDATPDYNLG